ncbi:hypothetical protein HNR46_002969 [Haloferula luteola]|uniref:PEP-CTERM protein-sorting domain-containing protein n=1 Tax=Haloferula luteola TaxID=595692 RepID=A0A840VJ45_9BACT|nr:DUF4465 domain-containing protein [Haloferula luteola]MBB5352721.1 hypothetical protein [Haloferula luteola]
MIPRIVAAAALLASLPALAVTVTFEDLTPSTAYAGGGAYENGSALAGSFTSGPLTLTNNYNSSWGSWSGWAFSTTTDITTPGYDNQFSAFAGSGAAGSATYAIAYNDSTIAIPSGYQIASLNLTNTTYAALSMRDGDAFAKQFGGTSGDDPDLFQVVFTGYLSGSSIGTVTFDLANYTFSDPSLDYLVADWMEVDLSSLAAADEISITFTSTDVGAWGINTPTYLAVDNIVLNAVPEPSILLLGALAPVALLRRRR